MERVRITGRGEGGRDINRNPGKGCLRTGTRPNRDRHNAWTGQRKKACKENYLSLGLKYNRHNQIEAGKGSPQKKTGKMDRSYKKKG